MGFSGSRGRPTSSRTATSSTSASTSRSSAVRSTRLAAERGEPERGEHDEDGCEGPEQALVRDLDAERPSGGDDVVSARVDDQDRWRGTRRAATRRRLRDRATREGVSGLNGERQPEDEQPEERPDVRRVRELSVRSRCRSRARSPARAGRSRARRRRGRRARASSSLSACEARQRAGDRRPALEDQERDAETDRERAELAVGVEYRDQADDSSDRDGDERDEHADVEARQSCRRLRVVHVA